MANMFGGPAKPAAVQALPQADDQQIQSAKLKQMAELDKSSGAGGNQLTESKLGDYSKAATRTGAMAPSQMATGMAKAA